MSEERQISYTTIDHIARRELGISMNEYALADLIYHLGNNPRSGYSGWCIAKKVVIGEMIGLTEQTVHALLNKLIEKGLIEKHHMTKNVRATEKWYLSVIVRKTKDSLVGLKTLYPVTKESLVTTYNNNNDNNIYSPDGESIKKDLISLPLTDGKKTFPNEKYTQVLDAYQRLKGITLTGPEFNRPKKAIKEMFLAGKTVEQIIGCMEIFARFQNEEGFTWMRSWTMETVCKKMPEFVAGQLKPRELIDDLPKL